MTRSQVLLSIRNATKRFGRATAVDSVSLDILENEFFALLGASGSGKTTLLRMLAGFETPDSGEIYLDGVEISRRPPNRRPVNLMFQSYALFPHMTVYRNVAYGLEMERVAKPEIKRRVDEILGTVQLASFADARPIQLSGGQRQRVALARALVKRPRVLLLDEPLSALDKKLREAMQIELKRLQDEIGITFVVVTHDQEESLVMSDRIAILRDGALLQCGEPRAVYERPANFYVADFIGVSNFVRGRIAEGGLATDGGNLVCGAIPRNARLGARAVASVRPERLKLFPGGGTENRLTGMIEAKAYRGTDMQVHVRTGSSEKPFVLRIGPESADSARLGIGERIEIGWAAAHTRIFEDSN